MASLTARAASHIPSNHNALPDIGKIPGIGHDQYRASRRDRHLLWTGLQRIGFTAIGVELAENCKISVTGVHRGIDVRPLWNFPPLGRDTAQARDVLEQRAGFVGRFPRPRPPFLKKQVEQGCIIIAGMPGRFGYWERVDCHEMSCKRSASAAAISIRRRAGASESSTTNKSLQLMVIGGILSL
jgi:hypothetical protein